MADRLLDTQYDFIRKAIGHAAEPLSRSDDANQGTPRGRQHDATTDHQTEPPDLNRRRPREYAPLRVL
jgi:hypothetical protein